jgi:hypothetical protein
MSRSISSFLFKLEKRFFFLFLVLLPPATHRSFFTTEDEEDEDADTAATLLSDAIHVAFLVCAFLLSAATSPPEYAPLCFTLPRLAFWLCFEA